LLAFPPIAGAEDADDPPTVRKSDRENPACHGPEAVVPFFCLTMGEVFSNDTAWIREGILRLRKRHTVLGLIFEVFLDVPFEACLAHGTRLADEEAKHHIKIWLYIWLRLLNLPPLTPIRLPNGFVKHRSAQQSITPPPKTAHPSK
jgi:hypothetical protein